MSNLVVDYILAALISLITPGNTVLSQVPIPICDEECQQTPLCENEHHWRCKKPQSDLELYNTYLSFYLSQGFTEEQAEYEARMRSFTRPETFEEGLVRYKIIAQAIVNVSEKLNKQNCRRLCANAHNEANAVCNETSVEQDQCFADAESEMIACNHACVKKSPWDGTQLELAMMMAVAMNQESGFRADVHGGTGKYGRGDCVWRYIKTGRIAPAFAKGAAPVPGTCPSVCLGQIKHGEEELLGVDLASTEKCVTQIARHMARARTMCTKWSKKKYKSWPKATFSAYGSGVSCRIHRKKKVKVGGVSAEHYAYHVKNDKGKLEIVWGAFPPDNAINKRPLEEPWPSKRTKMFEAYYSLYKKVSLQLSPEVKRTLEDPRVMQAYDVLANSKQQMVWMIPINMY